MVNADSLDLTTVRYTTTDYGIEEMSEIIAASQDPHVCESFFVTSSTTASPNAIMLQTYLNLLTASTDKQTVCMKTQTPTNLKEVPFGWGYKAYPASGYLNLRAV